MNSLSQGRTSPLSSAAFGASAGDSVAQAVRAFVAFITGAKQPTPLDLARKARWHAAEDYADAKRVGDTRLIHTTHAAFRRATAEVVRLELGR